MTNEELQELLYKKYCAKDIEQVNTLIKRKLNSIYGTNKKGNNMFNKKDLKSGDVIVRRNGYVEIICLETGTCICKDGWNDLDDINEDLTCDSIKFTNNKYSKDWDIMQVWRPSSSHQCNFDKKIYEEGTLMFDRERDCKPKFDKEKWMNEMYKRYSYDTFAKVITEYDSDYTVIVDTKTFATGVAKRRSADSNNNSNKIPIRSGKYLWGSFDISIAIAYCCLRNIEIPKEIFEN